LVEGKPISIGNVSYVLGMNSKKVHRWYQYVLSGYTEALERGEIGRDDLTIRENGKTKEIPVPILEPKNLGKQMAVDEKTIDGITYTIISNRQTGKIALMAATLKTSHLMKLMSKFEIEKRMQVKSLSRDMAANYDWLGRQAFMNAYHVVDKFHVIKSLMEFLQAIRIGYRQQEFALRRQAAQNKTPYIETNFSNGDTVLQLLARSRGLLFSTPDKWTDQQKQRAHILFERYPKIKTAYYLILKIRKWFSPPKGAKTYQVTRDKKQQQLKELIKELLKSDIYEMKNAAFLLKKHMGTILHYFIAKETNAKAEALNQNLQRFINVNYGARNTDFFLFRVKTHFA